MFISSIVFINLLVIIVVFCYFPSFSSFECQFSCCTYEGWLEHSKQIKLIAETEMESSCRMRESLFVARERSKNAIESQQEMTEHTLRKRIFDTQRARNEFEWQIIKVISKA